MSGQKEKDLPVNEPGFFYGYVIVVVAFMIMVVFWGAFYSFGVHSLVQSGSSIYSMEQ